MKYFLTILSAFLMGLSQQPIGCEWLAWFALIPLIYYFDNSDNIKNDPKCLLVKNKGGKISRNERCEATGKKFKNCCGAL